MGSQPSNLAYSAPPPFSPPLSAHRSSAEMTQPGSMDIDMTRSDYDRSTRAASVLSGMSMEDMEAAETLNSLQHHHSPRQTQPPPTLVQTQSTFDGNQPEPLLRLFTSQYPLAGSLINGSLSAYKTTQSYIPGAEWSETNIGLPIARTLARTSGVEGGLRWALQPKRDPKSSADPRPADIEKGIPDVAVNGTNRSSSEMLLPEGLPPYSAGDRSPPYTEQQLMHRQPPPGWRQQLVISTSGLGIAMSDESIRSLRYCLSWLRWANGKLGETIQNLRTLLEKWDEGATLGEQPATMSIANISETPEERRQAALTARIDALKAEVLQVLKHVMGIVSNYAGGALPDNARSLVHRHLTSLPQRFSIANMAGSEKADEDDANGDSEAAQNGKRVLVLATEGLEMMVQVSRVVGDTLMSAESWCEKLGRRGGQNSPQQQLQQQHGAVLEHSEKSGEMRGEWERGCSETLAPSEVSDVKMSM